MSERPRRLPGRIKEILAEAVGSLKDPRIGFVTITDVEVTTDGEHATAFYTVLPSTDADRERAQQGLESATPLLRRELASRLQVRRVPSLVLRHDPIPDRADRIEQLLAQVRDDDAAS